MDAKEELLVGDLYRRIKSHKFHERDVLALLIQLWRQVLRSYMPPAQQPTRHVRKEQRTWHMADGLGQRTESVRCFLRRECRRIRLDYWEEGSEGRLP